MSAFECRLVCVLRILHALKVKKLSDSYCKYTLYFTVVYHVEY